MFECERVFRDRMINETDMQTFDTFRQTVTKKYFSDYGLEDVEAQPLLFASFNTFTADDTPVYNEVEGFDSLKKTLSDKLEEYNETNAAMHLVLFQQAIEHICRSAT